MKNTEDADLKRDEREREKLRYLFVDYRIIVQDDL
jgi:hypothetical protein